MGKLGRPFKGTIFIIGIVLYLNTGWSLYSWYENNELVFQSADLVKSKPYDSKTVLEKILTGPDWWNDPVQPTYTPSDRIAARIIMMFLWPILFVIVGLTWLFHGVWLLFWLTFLGGLAKLIGIG